MLAESKCEEEEEEEEEKKKKKETTGFHTMRRPLRNQAVTDLMIGPC